MSTARIEIGYDGEAMNGGSMDVRELAPALLALGDLVQEAHNLLNDGRGSLTTHVKADFRKGSFDVNLELKDVIDQTAFIVEHCKHWSAKEIAAFIGLAGVGGMIGFLKWLGKRKVKKTTIIENGKIRVETDGEYDTIEISSEVLRLVKNQKTRWHLKAVFKPLRLLGIDLFYSKEQGERESTRVAKKDLPSFDVPELPEQPLTDQTRDLAVKVIGVFFEEGLKWKLADGENRFNAIVKDETFQKEIDAGKKFSKNDTLIVQLRTRQTSSGEGIKIEHEILKVTRHIPAETQTELSLTSLSESPNKIMFDLPPDANDGHHG